MVKTKKMALGGMSGPVKPGMPPQGIPMQGQPRPSPALAPNPGKPGPVNPGMGPKPMMPPQGMPMQGQPRPSPALAPNPGKPMGMKKGGTASARADGCATKGKTKGRFV